MELPSTFKKVYEFNNLCETPYSIEENKSIIDFTSKFADKLLRKIYEKIIKLNSHLGEKPKIVLHTSYSHLEKRLKKTLPLEEWELDKFKEFLDQLNKEVFIEVIDSFKLQYNIKSYNRGDNIVIPLKQFIEFINYYQLKKELPVAQRAIDEVIDENMKKILGKYKFLDRVDPKINQTTKVYLGIDKDVSNGIRMYLGKKSGIEGSYTNISNLITALRNLRQHEYCPGNLLTLSSIYLLSIHAYSEFISLWLYFIEELKEGAL